MDGSAWQKLRLISEAPNPKKKKVKEDPPEKLAAVAMSSNENSRRMLWRVMDRPTSDVGRRFMKILLSSGWVQGRVGIYDLLWHGDEWRQLSEPSGHGVGRSLQAILSFFEPISKETMRLYGWRGRVETDEPGPEFVKWAQDTLPNLLKFSHALPKYVDVRLEPVSAMGSKPGDVRLRSAPEHDPTPTILFSRDGSFQFKGPGGKTHPDLTGRVTVDVGTISAGNDVPEDEDDWIAGGDKVRLRGPHRSLSRTGGKVTGDGSLSRTLAAIHKIGLEKVVVASETSSDKDRRTPRAPTSHTPEEMAASWMKNGTPVPPGTWEVSGLRRLLRMIARETGSEL